jgi:hypothetical protein
VSSQNALIKWVSAGLVLVIVAAVAGYLVLTRQAPAPKAPPPQATAKAPTPVAPAPPQHPISRVAVAPAHAATAPLPALEDSDSMVRDDLSELTGRATGKMLIGGSLIQRFVATINALPGRELPANALPVTPPKGRFAVDTRDGAIVMAPANAKRYARYVDLFQKADTDKLVAWYVHSYPLFEKAWRQLGYPKSHFNDRLVQVLDLLLKTPVPAQPPQLQGSAGMYHFVDPKLENLAIGQKLLLRLGPKQEKAMIAKLRAIRAALVGQHPAASSSS